MLEHLVRGKGTRLIKASENLLLRIDISVRETISRKDSKKYARMVI